MRNLILFNDQDYQTLRKDCIKKDELFVDPTFPATNKSLYYSRVPVVKIQWLRPGIVEKPVLFYDFTSIEDVAQGHLGNCWFVASCGSIAERPELWKKMVPDYKHQEWSDKNSYAGIFHFRFWQMGQWIDVVIDDQLPTVNKKLIYTHSNNNDEFWSALVEKAYAKLYTSYEALSGGKARDAMVDMTGGVGESIRLNEFRAKNLQRKLFKTLHYAYENDALMSASIMAQNASEMEQKTKEGLVKGHAYSITSVKKLRVSDSMTSFFDTHNIYMLRLRNPWGGTVWNGAWSAGSVEWKYASEAMKNQLSLTAEEIEGEFWMSFEDFCKFFTDIDICHMLTNKHTKVKKTWREYKVKGEWEEPDRCGGCGNYDDFLNNPQYIMQVPHKQDVVLSLEQSEKRSKQSKNRENDVIGVTVFRAGVNQKYRVHINMNDKIHSGPFSNARGMFARVSCEKGNYCIIPSTFAPGILGRYFLRVYSKTNIKFRELTRDGPRQSRWHRRPYGAVTSITVYKGENLFKDDETHKSFCVVKCEGKQIKARTLSSNGDFEWNSRITFYRKKPEQDITVDVYEKRWPTNKHLGKTIIPMERSYWPDYQNMYKSSRYSLTRTGEEDSEEDSLDQPPYIWIITQQSEDLNELG